MTLKVIIDTDPGVDDAMAILMALASPEIEILGLTTVFGNATTEVTTSNALTLLETVGRSDIGVAAGEAKPIASDYLGPVPQVHGTNGLGDAELAPPIANCSSESAADFIHRFAVAQPGEVTLLALGPLTNLAVALTRYPDLPALIKRVVVMGGNALVPGNANPVAEANINNDPEAADLVFGAGWPVTMVGLDVTHQINLTGVGIDRITSADSAGARLLRQALPLYRRFFETTNGIDGIYLHDPSTVAYLLDPDAFTTRGWPIRVETESFSRGKTWPNLGETDDATPAAWLNRPLIDVCAGVDANRVVAMVVERLAESA
ncbi:MAG: nucleoside hydrolase [Acidimicrobiales bacterium]